MNTNETYITNGQLDDETKALVEIATKKDKTLNDWFKLGLSDIMYNGCDLYLDIEEYEEQEDSDSLCVYLYYDLEKKIYHTNDRLYTLTEEEAGQSIVTYIGSSAYDCCVPAIWIKPSREWFDNQKKKQQTQSEEPDTTE